MQSNNLSSKNISPPTPIIPLRVPVHVGHEAALKHLADQYTCDSHTFQRLVALSLEIIGVFPIPLPLGYGALKKEFTLKFTDVNDVTLENLIVGKVQFSGEIHYVSGPKCKPLFFGKGNITFKTKEIGYSKLPGTWFNYTFYPHDYDNISSFIVAFNAPPGVLRPIVPNVGFEDQYVRYVIVPVIGNFWSIHMKSKTMAGLAFIGTLSGYQPLPEHPNNLLPFTVSTLNGTLRLGEITDLSVYKSDADIVIEGKTRMSMEKFYRIFRLPREKLLSIGGTIPKNDPGYQAKVITSLCDLVNVESGVATKDVNHVADDMNHAADDMNHDAELMFEFLSSVTKKRKDPDV